MLKSSFYTFDGLGNDGMLIKSKKAILPNLRCKVKENFFNLQE